MPGRLTGKVALITGAGSGIGLEASILFAKEGAQVVAADINEQSGQATVKKIHDLVGPKSAVFVRVDVAKESDIANAVKVAETEYGKLNIVFNNAGIMHPADDDAINTEEKIWDLTMQINVKGVWWGCKHAIPALRRAGGGSIINTASFVALRGAATPQLAYTSSKGAVLAMTRELSVIHARENIRVNALCPGPIRTPLLMDFLNTEEKKQRRLIHVPMGRFGEAIEQAYAVLFLASDESSFITGTDFLVDGGLTAAYVTPEGQTKSLPPHSNFSGV
ncbi:uncharacterized protein SPPG_01580 [Spizellomyces punctatus DAOM BR117]|uniref:Glucose 1-dehydrogenase n=1 Tax=Spizellomyces punctatus (strain DAOM BR117) TaxID=645134 RepID=A0A0L0HTC2_SPIPD|nr:uncharacterized protein SPPG_01580 [Spizellomyces punctatus DAOM BR117]KND04145.1 hypothetical protein SPPG_01580 [Spizellomyces punctatus DAOM BR117]|eukprot:XP_016612184.1 hypothetical protein SPPG_01580 [Spizellomyces punctatus DAOM BR117]